jgi:hypothetical protein
VLRAKFDMVDFGEAKSILGINVQRVMGRGTMTLEQSYYIQNLLTKFRLSNFGYSSTPIDKAPPSMSKAHCPVTEQERSASLINLIGKL